MSAAMFVPTLGKAQSPEVEARTSRAAAGTPSKEALCEGLPEEPVPNLPCNSFNIYHLYMKADKGQTKGRIDRLADRHNLQIEKCERARLPRLRFKEKSVVRLTIFFKSLPGYTEERREFNRQLNRISSDPEVLLLSQHGSIETACPKP